jgi:hypothetical protein
MLAPHGINYRTEISEKSFKPMAFYHPFIAYGSEGTLRYLHREGFETFPELFDESYDDILDDQERFTAVTRSVFTAVEQYRTGALDCSIVQQKLQHNHDRLFDLALVKQRFYNEIITPVLEYANA